MKIFNIFKRKHSIFVNVEALTKVSIESNNIVIISKCGNFESRRKIIIPIKDYISNSTIKLGNPMRTIRYDKYLITKDTYLVFRNSVQAYKMPLWTFEKKPGNKDYFYAFRLKQIIDAINEKLLISTEILEIIPFYL